jgi:hypothetical protein
MVPGEEDALARGALQVMVHPASGGDFLATCALGFNERSMPTAIFACPNENEMCAVAGGYAYVIDTLAPEHSTHLPQRPVVEVVPVPSHELLLFAGFHTIYAWGRGGETWQTSRLTWEGLKIAKIEDDMLHGTGWDLMSDREVPFQVDLRTGAHKGGAAPNSR